MIGHYKVITLCGSTRFKDEFMEAQKRLPLEGNIMFDIFEPKVRNPVERLFTSYSVELHM